MATSPLQSALDAGIWYHLNLWPALQAAVSNQWGGPDSADKRDWLAGAVSELLATFPAPAMTADDPVKAKEERAEQQTQQEDLEVLLLQVMQDEFECQVEDESEVDAAAGIMTLRRRVWLEGSDAAVKEVEARWKSRERSSWNSGVGMRRKKMMMMMRRSGTVSKMTGM